MTWTVMRRDVDRNVRVAVCATEDEARAQLHRARRGYPGEEAWIEGAAPESERQAPAPPIVEHFAGTVPMWGGEIPQARIVSEHGGPRMVRTPSSNTAQRAVPWRAAMAVVDRSTGWTLLVLVLLPYFFGRLRIDALAHHERVPVTAKELAVITFVSLGAAIAVFAARLWSARTFLQRALVVDGVVTPRGIEVTIDGRTNLVARKRRMSAEGSRVHLFWFGRRTVQLARIGATCEPNGEVVWKERTATIFLIGRGLVALLVAFRLFFPVIVGLAL